MDNVKLSKNCVMFILYFFHCFYLLFVGICLAKSCDEQRACWALLSHMIVNSNVDKLF